MLWQKFRYDEYEQFQEHQEYDRAQKYCGYFPNDPNAVICGLYSKYSLLEYNAGTAAPLSEMDDKIRKLYQSFDSKRKQSYDKDALYLLGDLLFACRRETEGKKVLRYVASLGTERKKRERLSEVEKKARLYLERHYFQKWENSHEMADLKQAADCFGHSEVCYLYAELLREGGEDRNLEEAIPYETLWAMYYCAIWMDKVTFYQKRGKKHLDQIRNDIRKDIGSIASDIAMFRESIESHLEIMLRKMNELPETIRNDLKQEFNGFRTQMSELSEQMETREETVRSLIERAREIDLEQQGNRDAVLEIKTLAEQIRTADQEREARLARSIDGLKNAVLKNKNRLLQEIVDEAAAEIESRFQDRLLKDARNSIITALFTLNFYKELNKEHEAQVEYSGVVILATSALEIELQRRLYVPFKEYVEDQCGRDIFKKWYLPYFTLRSFTFIAGVERKEAAYRKERTQLFGAFIKDPKYSSQFSDSADSLFYFKTGAELRSRLESFANRLNKLGKIRNKAAHIDPVTFKDAEEACQSVFLSSQKHASSVMDESISLLELLLNSSTL